MLKSTTIDFSFGQHLFEWVGVPASSLRLRSLSIGLGVVVRNQAVLGRLLRTLGPTLEELSIQGFPIWPDTEGENIMLSGALHSTYM